MSHRHFIPCVSSARDIVGTSFGLWKSTIRTSKIRTALGGTFPDALPRSPYPQLGGILIRRFSPVQAPKSP